MQQVKNKKVIMLSSDDQSSKIVYHRLSQHYTIDKVIIEQKISRRVFLKRRIKKLGYFRVIGQILFQLITVQYLKRKSSARITELYNTYHLDTSDIPKKIIIRVQAINDKHVIDVLRTSPPDVVVVNGTRIISEEVLNCIPAKFINTHAGITPLYRGVHGAYWALVNKDPEHCGVTVHLIDKGIDTGDIIYQKNILPTQSDDFITYPILQLATVLPLLVKSISDAFEGNLKSAQRHDLDSKIWYHPTIFQYHKYKWRDGIN